MSIIDRLKRLIFGASAEPVKQRPMNAAQPKPKIITTIEKSQNNINKHWRANDDIIKGLEFIATLQLRTPLRVLLRHGEIHTDINTEPPKIIKEMWEGGWVTKTKTYRELGLDLDEVPEGSHASNIGLVKPSEYLPLLFAIRKIVELDEPIDSRIKKLRGMPMVSDCQTLVSRHGPSYKNESRGMEWIIEYLFPRFVKSIPKISAGMVDELCKLGLDTPNRIAATPNETLLSIKGIGQSKLKTIRDYCAGITKNRDADRLEDVIR